jgi:hypothetical protein
VPFWVLDGFAKISASGLEGMAGTTGLEPAASAVTDSPFLILEETLWPAYRTQIGPRFL